ncbi:glycosyltransferase family 2 protein [Orenia marismortui]|uniref:glycosyltransferase family 2 protein n=1 Tax=Orenia marismortui TaxID=46469 RepID=UPI0003655E1D|nr:glycosyltransferase family 2 protein [Orenia marismortui]
MEEDEMREEPLVSIITVCYNSEKYIKDTIESVLAQDYYNIEYIIVDGKSIDGTLDIVKEYEPKFDGKMKWISEEDNGIYDAMNKGIKMASGEIIGIINSDDWYEGDIVQKVVDIYNQYKEDNLIITGSMCRVDQEGRKLFKLPKDKNNLDELIDITMPINHPATFVTQRVYDSVGVFDENFKICGDYDFIYRAYYSDTTKFIFIDDLVSYMRLGGVSGQFDNLWLHVLENYKLRKGKLNNIINSYYSVKFLLKHMLKYGIKKIINKELLLKYYKLRH